MTKSNRAIKIAISLLLAISLFCCSFSVYAYDEGDRVTSQEYLWAYYIYEFLNSIGIKIEYRGIIEYINEIQDTIIDWAIEYIADEIEAELMPSNYSIAKWVAPWQAGYDYWGNLQFNSTMLEDLEDFATWLKAKFSLINDDVIVVNPVYSLNGYQLYNYNQWYPCEYSDGTPYQDYINVNYTIEQGSTRPLGFFFVRYQHAQGHMVCECYSVAVTINNMGSNRIGVYAMDDGGDINRVSLGAQPADQFWNLSSGGVYYTTNNFVAKPGTGELLWIPGDNVTDLTLSQIRNQFLPNLEVVQEGDIRIVTATISMPSLDPTYEAGDGMTIVDGEPVYEEIVFSGEVTNLPAIVSTGEIANPEIDQIYTNIPALVDEAGDSMEIMRQIIFRMPDGVLIALYGLLSAGVIFGFLRIMREH